MRLQKGYYYGNQMLTEGVVGATQIWRWY